MVLTCLIKGCVLVAYIWSCASAVAAQNLTIPSETWRNFTSSLSRESREDLAHAAAIPFSNMDISVGSSSGLPRVQDVTSVYSLLALQDYRSGNLTWRDMGTDSLQALIKKRGGFWGDGTKIYSDVIYWGLGLFYSYRTYQQQFLLDYAESAWNITYTGAFINTSAAASGVGLGRNVSFSPPSNCTGGTFAGGVFVYEDIPSNLYVNMEAVGPMLALSAYLFEETKDLAYQQAAQLSLDFIINHLWNGTIVFDGITLDSCQTIPKPFSINQAWFVEGLAVWANVTQNDSLSTLLEIAVPSITAFPAWSSPDGVLNGRLLGLMRVPEDIERQDLDSDPELDSADQILKGIFIRGLAEARMRNPGTDLARYIEAYITLQFNSLLDHARAAPANDGFYSESWIGPPATSFEAGGNVAGLDVLNAAFSLVEPSTNSSTNRPPPTSTPRLTPKSSNTDVIVGGVVGGVVAVVATIATILLCRRRRRSRAVDLVDDENDAPRIDTVEPFVSRPAYNPTTLSKWERMNLAYQNSAPPQLVTPPMPASDASRGQASNPGSIDVADLPSLVQFLKTFLQGRQGELPPYER